MKLDRTRQAILLASWIAWIPCIPPAVAQGNGIVCLVPGDFDEVGKGGATVEAYEAAQQHPRPAGVEAVRYVRVDKLPAAKVTSLKPGRIEGIGTAGRHLIHVAKQSDMSQPVATFRFSFQEQKSKKLCLWFETFYGSWRLQKDKFCNCR